LSCRGARRSESAIVSCFAQLDMRKVKGRRPVRPPCRDRRHGEGSRKRQESHPQTPPQNRRIKEHRRWIRKHKRRIEAIQQRIEAHQGSIERHRLLSNDGVALDVVQGVRCDAHVLASNSPLSVGEGEDEDEDEPNEPTRLSEGDDVEEEPVSPGAAQGRAVAGPVVVEQADMYPSSAADEDRMLAAAISHSLECCVQIDDDMSDTESE